MPGGGVAPQPEQARQHRRKAGRAGQKRRGTPACKEPGDHLEVTVGLRVENDDQRPSYREERGSRVRAAGNNGHGDACLRGDDGFNRRLADRVRRVARIPRPVERQSFHVLDAASRDPVRIRERGDEVQLLGIPWR